MNALPLLWLSTFFIFGLFSANFITSSISILIELATVGVALVIIEFSIGKKWRFFQKRPRIAPFAIGILWMAFLTGFIRQQTSLVDLSKDQAGWYNGAGKVTLTGTISAPPTKSERFIQASLEVQSLVLPDGQNIHPIRGTVLLWLSKDSHWEYGDQLQVLGNLNTPFEDAVFSYKDFLAQQGINSLMIYPKTILLGKNHGNPILALLNDIRTTADQTLRQLLPMPESAVASGILLGRQDNIPKDIYQAYQASGTAHILVISGFNIAILSALISRFFRRILPYGWDAFASAGAILFYTLLVGAEPPVVRAAIMGILALPATLLGRRMIPLNMLVFTAALMLFFSPNLLQDISFQLTFLATLGIILFCDPIDQFVGKGLLKFSSAFAQSTRTSWIKEYLIVTLTAQIGVLPVLLSHFNYQSLLTLPANLLILPAQPLIMASSGITLVTGLIFLPAGNLVAKLAWLPLLYSDQMALWMGALPFAMIKTTTSWAWIGWVALLGLTFPALRYHFQLLEKPKEKSIRKTPEKG